MVTRDRAMNRLRILHPVVRARTLKVVGPTSSTGCYSSRGRAREAMPARCTGVARGWSPGMPYPSKRLIWIGGGAAVGHRGDQAMAVGVEVAFRARGHRAPFVAQRIVGHSLPRQQLPRNDPLNLFASPLGLQRLHCPLTKKNLRVPKMERPPLERGRSIDGDGPGEQV
jgi:hypothetical protein